MASIGVERFIYFRMADTSGVPITGRVQSNFAIIFTRNNLTPPDTLTVSEIGAGRYYASYLPSTAGEDYVEIYDAPTDTRVVDVEVIEEAGAGAGSSGSSIITVTQDFGGTGALRPTVSDIGTYTLYAFLSSDWSVGRTDPSYAAAAYHLDSTGNWTLNLLPGTYDLVLINTLGAVIVFRFNLVVAL